MKNLLIVDDERMIRQGLKAMIEREYPSRYNIALASNGAEALELFRQERRDIIITDIRMPVMDGMALLENLSKESLPGEGPAVVILSGFDDFEYAKNAIRHRVKDYLLKPIRREELFDILERINEEWKSRESSARRLAQEQAGYRRELRAARLGGLLMQEDVEPSQEQLEELHKLERPFSVGVLNYYYNDGTRMKPGEVQGLIERLTGPLEQKFMEILTDWEGKLVLVAGGKESFLELTKQAAAKDLKGLTAGIGRSTGNPEDFRSSYKEACRALQYTFLSPQANFVDYESIREGRLSFASPEKELHKLLNMLGTDREKEMKALLGVIFQTEHLSELDLSYLESVGRSINERVLDEIFRVHGEASVEVLKLYRTVGNLYNFRHFHDYYRALEHLLISVNDYIIGLRSAHTEHADMRKALDYIEVNYARPLNMAMVSNHVSLNYSYFSEAFKAYTGESFVLYLKKVRIRHAKTLLAENLIKLGEVSEAVGFENSKQFTRVFKELEGISPGEYRAKRLMEQGSGRTGEDS
ncbi:DNA-binding response regulator [Paenibacillus sp. PK3_47]|uniref:response regulator n=1 Tax=Paenibacillus sp. PK3_47 TaxID=2072642 RepID=UPI00201D903A|nr:response regulator [Paenibacillus sp. PK3_47]UQZ34542.1 DNA-binding response regulator [Paenibacillus sp. PK3_47]